MLSCEAIGSIPRTRKLQNAMQAGDVEAIVTAQRDALEATINALTTISATNPICDGEQVRYAIL